MLAQSQSRAGDAAIDLLAERERLRQTLIESGEADRLAAAIDPGDTRSIVTFGASASQAIGRTSDELLRGMGAGPSEDSGQLMEALAGVMARIDPDALAAKPGLLGRLLGRRGPGTDDLLNRYDALGGDLDRVFVRLKAHTATLARDNRQLEGLLEANVGYYRELEKYILAGERAIQALRQRLARLEAEQGGGAASFETQTLRNAVATLERRVQDLRTSELVAMQTIPMIQAMRRNNRLLIDRIDAALLVTLPAFRQGLAAAILEKRRRLQGEAMAALNARAAAADGAGDVGAKLGELRRSVVSGIDEVRRLSADAEAQRQRDRARLEALRVTGGSEG